MSRNTNREQAGNGASFDNLIAQHIRIRTCAKIKRMSVKTIVEGETEEREVGKCLYVHTET